MDLPLLSALFLVFALALYVLLDGFDLGVGALLLLEPDENHRDRMIDAIAPTWDGNETWLIMAGVTLLAGFPTAYGVLLPAFYVPLVAMLLSLGLRGVSFEFRYQTVRSRRRWDVVFACGSMLAATCQGIVVGGMIVGVATEHGAFTGGALDWFKPLPLFFGFTALVGYAVLGAGWLFLKGDAKTRELAANVLRPGAILFLGLGLVAALWAARAQPLVVAAWGKHFGTLVVLVIVAVGAGLSVGLLARSPSNRWDAAPFLGGVTMLGAVLLILVVSVAPNLVPFRLSLWEVASPAASHRFLLIGALCVTPVVIGYNAYAYWVFRGKTREGGLAE